MPLDSIEINRAPVLTLWIAIVANVQGYDWDSSLTIGKAFAGLNAQDKGRALGIFSQSRTSQGIPSKKHGLGEEFWIHIGGRGIPMKNLEDGVRAVVKDKPIDPRSVETYFGKAFGESLAAVREAMERLAKAYNPCELDVRAFGLYEKFRPKIASGQRGWGQKGKLDLGIIRELAAKPV
jgi:hypothetical protein